MIPFILGALAAVGLSELSKRNKPKMADGGGVGTHLDLFENYEMMPKNLKKIVDKYSRKYESGNMDYRDTEKFLKEVEAIGYTFDYYLDNEPYGLRPVGVKLNELEGYEDMGEEEYAKGGGVSGKDKPKNVLSLLSKFNKEKPSILLIMIADDVSDEFMRKKFDETITWDKLSDSEKQKYNEDYKINKDKFEKYLMYEFVKLYYSDDKIKNKCKGQSRATINSIKSVMVSLAKKYSKDKYAKGGGVGDKVYKKYYVIDDNNNGFWQDELSDREKAVMVYNPKTDVWHTRRNYEDYYFKNRTKNPREYATGGGVGNGGELQVGDMVKIVPDYESIYANAKGSIFKIMPDGKTYEIKIKRKVGNEYVKFDRSELLLYNKNN